MEWRETTYIPGLEINRQGETRNKLTGKMIAHKEHPANPRIPVVQMCCLDGVIRRSQINVLLEETFGPGAAEAAGLPAPDMEKVRKGRKYAEDRRLGVWQPKAKGKLDQPINGKRKCTDCGKPTHNYRCEKCWKKRRGFSFEDTGEEGLVTADARETAAKRKKKDIKTSNMDWFVPLTKFGKSPPPPPPGEQKRIVAAMPAKGHAAQMPYPVGGFWMPTRNRKKENPMPEENTTKNTYTVREIAELIGVSAKDVQNAKHSKTKDPKPGSANHTIRIYMASKGITWEQIVNGHRGRKAGEKAGAPVPTAATITAISSEAPRIVTDESGNTRAEGPEILFIDDAVLPDPAPEQEPTPQRPEAATVFSLAHLPLEALVMEITRRMPRAEVVLR